MRPKACGLEYPHVPHLWFDGDHDPEDHQCPGIVVTTCGSCGRDLTAEEKHLEFTVCSPCKAVRVDR